MKKFQSIFLSITFLIIFFVSVPALTFADTANTGSSTAQSGSTICAPNDSTVGSGGNVSSCINHIYIISVATIASIGVLMIVIAGYLYMAGGEGGVKKAKEIVQSVVIAMIILFGTFILLNTINPDLINTSGLVLSNVNCTVGNDPNNNCVIPPFSGGITTGGTNNGGAGTGGGATVGGTGTGGVPGCSTCVDFGGDPYDLPTKATVVGDPSLAQKLVGLYNQTKADSVEWYATASYEPSGHSSSCHSKGTCVDVGANGDANDKLVTLCKDMKSSGFTIVNEYSADPSVSAACGAYKIFDTTNGNNFHIY